MPATRSLPEQPAPIHLTRELIDVSVTERGQFRTCRRRWFLETIENLVPKTPSLAFTFGEGLHSALEAYYLALGKGVERDNALDRAHVALDKWYVGADDKLIRDSQPTDILDQLYELGKLGHKMLDNYIEFDELAKVQLGEVVAVEGIDARSHNVLKMNRPAGYPKEADVIRHPSGRMLVPIVNPLTREPLTRKYEGKKMIVYLSARIDLLTTRKTPKKGLWITDHKSAAKAPSDRGLDLDDQITGYCYTVWRMTGRIPRGVVYNVLIKDEPKEPRVGTKGNLSYAKDQLTTPDMYREALREHGLLGRGGKITSKPHAECMASLLAHGWDRFFRRFEVPRNEYQLSSYEERLFFEFMDMEEAIENHELLYPNPSAFLCPPCSVKPVCLAMEDGSDFQDIIDHMYVHGEDRKA